MSPMNRLSELKEKKKLDNNGFSLVELIIVIAIMAVLIGVLAPQYLKYVEKSRRSADLDLVDSMVSAVEIYSADPDHAIVAGTLSCDSDGKITASSQVTAALSDAGITLTSTTATKSSTLKGWTITFASTGISFGSTTGDTELKKGLGR